MKFLVRTLGYRVSLYTRALDFRDRAIKAKLQCYEVAWTPHDGKGGGKAISRKSKTKVFNPRRIGIRSIKQVDSKPGRCIQVDSSDGLYLIGESLIPTHNSELTSYWFPLWYLAKNPTKRIILVSYESDFAALWSRRCRDAIINLGDKFGLQMDPGVTRANEWVLTTGGGMRSAGAGGPIVGRGADILIIDDPIKNYDEASSEIERENLWNWLQTTAISRLEPGAAVALICTRWHEDDLLGRLERFSRSGEGLPWEIIKLPAVAESDDILGRIPGEALWHERYPAITEQRDGRFYQGLDDIKKGMSPYNWSAVYQQNPTPDEGSAISRDWWKFYDSLPELDVMIQSWDLPLKDGEENDYAVGQVWGRKGANLYLVDQIRGHMNTPTVISAIRKLTQIYPKATAKLVEDTAMGPAVIAMLQHEVYGLIPIKPRGSKMARLQAVVPAIHSSNVYLPKGEKAPWIWDLIHEHAALPNGQHDDQVDATTQALKYLTPQGWSEISRDMKLAKEGPPPTTTVQLMERDLHKSMKKKVKTKEKKLLKALKPFSVRKHQSW